MTREEALQELRCFIGQLTEGCQEAIKALIPELKESEDERIRKELLAVINDLVLPDEQKARFNAWLEKQKEQKLNPSNSVGLEQKPVEWSEEDEHRYGDAIYFLETAKTHYADTSELGKKGGGKCKNSTKKFTRLSEK